MTGKNCRALMVACLCSTVLATPAIAQTNPVAAGDAADADERDAQDAGVDSGTAGTVDGARDRVEEIVVIGRKRARAEELQEVPVSITAFSAEQLQSTVVRDLTDISSLSPSASLQSSSQRGVQNFAIRGTGVSGTTPSDEPAVGVFQDGVYWGSNYGALTELFDVEGVEILRGPQGTLFGRNVTGGAVSLRSARPSAIPYKRLSVGVSNGLGLDASAILSGPVSDTISARLAVMQRANAGLYENIDTGTEYGKSYVTIVRPSVKFEPSDTFDLTLLGEFYSQTGDPTPVRGISPRTIGASDNLAELAGYETSPDFTEIQVGDRGFTDVQVYFGMAEANLQIGPGTLTSITGYRQVTSRNQTDFDGFPVGGFLQYAETDQHQFSEELRYAADVSDWLGFTVGGYYFDQRIAYAESRDLANGATRVATRSILQNQSYAAFAEADIRPFDGLTLTLGGRYTSENKTPQAARFGACPFNLQSPCTFETAPKYSGDNFSPKVGLAYQINPDALIFASWTRGFRSGGFSLRGTPLGAPYSEETVDAYEAGFKLDLLDRRVRFNVSAYYNKFNDLQRTVLDTDPVLGVVQAVFNAADATIKGAEVELTVVPTSGLTLRGVYGYTDASYETFTGFANPEDLEFVRVPKHTGSASIDYEGNIGSRRAGVHADVTYSGRYYFDDPNNLSQDPYALVNAKIFVDLTDQLTLDIYARNLLDKQYNVWGSTLGSLGENRFPGAPRTYGARLTLTF